VSSIMKHALNQSDVNQQAPASFWQSVSFELFSNMRSLYESIDTFFFLRSPDDGFPAMFVGAAKSFRVSCANSQTRSFVCTYAGRVHHICGSGHNVSIHSVILINTNKICSVPSFKH
jgi:hypothetical protein